MPIPAAIIESFAECPRCRCWISWEGRISNDAVWCPRCKHVFGAEWDPFCLDLPTIKYVAAFDEVELPESVFVGEKSIIIKIGEYELFTLRRGVVNDSQLAQEQKGRAYVPNS